MIEDKLVLLQASIRHALFTKSLSFSQGWRKGLHAMPVSENTHEKAKIVHLV